MSHAMSIDDGRGDPSTSGGDVLVADARNRHPADPGQAPPRAALATAPELCIVVPTFNEAANVAELLTRLRQQLRDVAWEIIFVDDNSPDGTAALVRELSRTDPRVRTIRRVGRRGLSSACIEGMMATSAPLIAVMDADLQHDEALLPQMLEVMRGGDLDLVVASRYVAGGGVGTWDEGRQQASRLATRLAHLAISAELTDPMSGFFMVRASVVHDIVPRLSGIGFKVLLDIMASSDRTLRHLELPYEFRDRKAGDSKLDNKVMWDYLVLLGDKTVGRFVPIRFVLFSLVGGAGVFVHLTALWLLFDAVGLPFVWAQGGATLVAMTANFLVNNELTYRDRRLRGVALLRGWLSFVAACGIGAAANVGVASYLFTQQTGWVLSAMAGIAIGAVWNYAVTAAYTWRTAR